MSLWSRAANHLRPRRVERDLDDELQFHLEQRIEELVAAGLTREAATAQATRRFGNPSRWREQSLDFKLLPWLDSVLRDVRLGFRTLRKNGIVTGAAVASLSLALGACVAAFSLVDALILRQLPVRQPDRLVYVAFPTDNAERPESDTFNDPTFVRLRDAGRGHIDLFAMSTQVLRPVIFADARGEKERVRTQYVSGDAFERLGIRASIGRVIAQQDDTQPGISPIAVLSHAYWQRRFGGDPSIVGQWLSMDEARQTRQFQIVGVVEAGFTGVEPGRPTDVWFPYVMYNQRAFGNYDFNWFRIMGRIADGASVDRAQPVLRATFTNIRRERAERYMFDRSPENVARFIATPLYLRSAANGTSPLRLEFARSLWILSGIAALVLLIAGSNVANLFLARTAARERELSLRLSIGASRGRLIQQVLIESALVAAAACMIGLLFAAVAGPTVVGMLTPTDDPVYLDLRFDWRLIAFASALTLLTTALFGIVPALRASGVAPITALKGTGRGAARIGAMRPFIAVQVAFGLVVLFVGGLLVLSFSRLSRVDPGFSSSSVLLVSLETVQRMDPVQQRAAILQLIERLRSVSGVTAISAAEFGALGRAWTHGFRVPGTEHRTFEATVSPVAHGYFHTMSIPVVAGRGFKGQEITEHAKVVVVNESFAARYFGGDTVIGRVLDTKFADNEGEGGHEIVGVVADTRYDLRKPAAPTIYIPLTQRGSGTIHARVSGDAAATGAFLREAVRAANPLFRVSTMRTQSAVVGQTLIRERLLALLSGFFAIVGSVLAAVGLYGVSSYSVLQRTREIGIRVALGAQQAGVIRTVLFDAAAAAAVGAVFGMAGGVYASRFVTSLLFEVSPLEFWSLTLPIGTLFTAALIASVAPALRAARVDPVTALRCE